MVTRPRHYTNYGSAGDTLFVTTTCLDFVHAFSPERCREAMALSLMDDCLHYGAPLSAFVVMPHHVHLLVAVPDGRDGRWLVNRLKANSAKRVRPLLGPDVERGFDSQRGLNGRVFWQRSYRSLVVRSPEVFEQKLRYIHWNPVRAALSATPDEYRWSSAWLLGEGLWSPEQGLDLAASLARFRLALV